MSFLNWFRTKQRPDERSRPTPPGEGPTAQQPREPDVEALRKRRDLDGLLRVVRGTGPSFSASVPVRGAAAKAFAELAGPRAFEILSAEIAETDRVLAKMREFLDLCLTSEMKRKPSEDIRALVPLKELLVEARIRCVPVAASLVVPAPPESPEPPSHAGTTGTQKGTIEYMSQICCVCFEDKTGEPAMSDSMTGNVFCQEHSYCLNEMQRGLNTKHCPSCNFGYYASYGSYVKGYMEGNEIKCPVCGECLRERIQ